VLATDPRRVPPSEIVNIKIERTMVDGKWVFES
jgi:predicted amidohydrolase YtcJ